MGRRGEARERAILAATLDVLVDLGYEGMTMDAVAARSRASKATIYRRWRGKPELVKAALDSHDAALAAEVPDTGSLRGDLLAALRATQARLTDRYLALMSALAHAMRQDADLARALRVHLSEDRDGSLFGPIVRRAQARGEVSLAADAGLAHEVTEGQLLRQMLIGEVIDEALIVHLTDDLLIPLLTQGGRHD